MVDQYIVEFDYQVYCAYETLLDELHHISMQYKTVITEAQAEILNELALSSVSTYISKVIAAIQDTWNKFISGVRSGWWESYVKAHGDTLNSSTFRMEVAEGVRVPKISEVKAMVKIEIPEWKKELDLESEEKFLQSNTDLKYFYEEGKSIREVAENKCIVELKESFIIGGSSDLKVYKNFMDDYEKISDGISSDIRRINNSSKEIKRKAEDARRRKEKADKEKEEAEKKAKEEENKEKAVQKADSNNTSTNTEPKNDQVQINNASAIISPNIAQFFLESFIAEANPKFSNADKKDDESSSDSSNNDSDSTPEGLLTDKELEGVTVYWRTATSILSAKMKVCNTCRKETLKLIKNFVRLSDKADKDIKKEKKKAEKEARNV